MLKSLHGVALLFAAGSLFLLEWLYRRLDGTPYFRQMKKLIATLTTCVVCWVDMSRSISLRASDDFIGLGNCNECCVASLLSGKTQIVYQLHKLKIVFICRCVVWMADTNRSMWLMLQLPLRGRVLFLSIRGSISEGVSDL